MGESMGESMIGIKETVPMGCGPIPPTFKDMVEAFCLQQAELRSRLALVGGEAERQALTIARGCDAHGTGP